MGNNITAEIGRDNYGDFAGGDITKIIYEGDQAYDVRGLKNPYLGLQAFTYAERERYAGREVDVRRAVNLLIQPGNERTLLFVTGASGSGKSSFAQAGILPVLESYYRQQGFTTKWAVFRPGEKPLAGLAGALRTLNLAAEGLFASAAKYQLMPPSSADPNQISLLVMDQFEELFSQSEMTQRKIIFSILAELPPFKEIRLQIIVTMRADYLPDLFADKKLYEIAKAGIDLRAMSEDELKVAIQNPLKSFHPNAGKRFQDALCNRLAKDATGDAAYLPLLQVTLDDLWRIGILTIDHYENLTAAIRKRADEIYSYKQSSDGRLVARSNVEQQMILSIFLDLVDVSLEDDIRRDVRRTRRLVDVARGRPNADALIQELASARLLATDEKILDDSSEDVEAVDIIHESLIVNWARLSGAINAQREQLQQRRRFELRLDEWLKRKKNKEYLLQDVYLAEAEHLRQIDDIAIRSELATEFINNSVQRREQRRWRERQITASTIAVLSFLLILATYFGIESRRRAAEAESREGAAMALLLLEEDPQQSAKIAARAYQQMPTIEAGDALRQALHTIRLTNTFTYEVENILHPSFSYDGELVAWVNKQGEIEIHKSMGGELLATYSLGGNVTRMIFAPNERKWLLAGSEHGDVALWDVTTGEQLTSLSHDSKQSITALAISPNGKYALTGSWFDHTIHLWSLPDGIHIQSQVDDSFLPYDFAVNYDQSLIAMGDRAGNVVLWDGLLATQLHSWPAHDSWITELLFSPNGNQLATASTDRKVLVWNSTNWNSTNPIDVQLLYRLDEHHGAIYHLVYNQDGSCLATSSEDTKTIIWNLAPGSLLFDTGGRVATLAGHTKSVLRAVFWPTENYKMLRPTQQCGSQVITVGDDQTIRTWNIGATSEFKTIAEHDGSVEVVQYSSDGYYLGTASDDHTAKILDTESFQVVRVIKHEDRVTDIEFSPDGNSVITTSWDGTAKITQIDTGDIRTLKGHIGKVQNASFQPPSGKIVATSGEDGVLILWDVATSSALISETIHDKAIYATTFNQDGSMLSTSSADGSAKLLDSKLKLLNQFDHNGLPVYDVKFSPDGNHVVTSASDGIIRIWPIFDIKPIILDAHPGSSVFEINYGWIQNQPIMLSAGGDGQTKMWATDMDTHTYTYLGLLPGHLGIVNSVSFQAGKVATAGNDGTVRIYFADIGQYLAIQSKGD